MSSSVMIQSQPSMKNFHSHPLVIGFVYASLILLVLLPKVDLMNSLIGYWGTDTIDTLSLRWFFFHSDSYFFPHEFNAYQLIPNFVDHLSALPFTLLLPFPLADNVWWISILWLNGMSAHWMGNVLGNSTRSGWICGTTILFSEYFLREINWGHAPQIMWFPALFCLTFLVRWHRENDPKDLRFSGVCLGISGWCYFYFVPFISILLIPLLWRKSIQHTVSLFGVAFIVIIPNLIWLFAISTPMLSTPTPPLINGTTLTELHSADWTWLWSKSPLDITNQQSILVLFGCIIGGYNARKSPLLWMGLMGLVVGGLLLMGEQTSLYKFVHSIPPMSRLLWPERWGIVFLTGTLILISQAPRFIWFAPLLMIEMTIRSENAPLHMEDIRSFQCLDSLKNLNGAILELPIQKGESLYNIRGLRQRIHKRPLVNPFILPPTVQPPKEWEDTKNSNWLQTVDGRQSQLGLDDVSLMGVDVILVDKVLLPLSQQNEIVEHLSPLFGSPQDLGCAWIWHTDTTAPMFPAKGFIKHDYSKPDSIQKPMQ